MQKTLEFVVAQSQPAMTLQERMKETQRVVNQWLDARSDIYSRIAEIEVTRRTVMRVNLVTAALVVVIMAVETQPMVAVASMASAAWLTYRFKKTEKGGKA